MSKVVIVVRKDLGMTKGKIVAQANHAITGILIRQMNNGKSLKENPPNIIDGKYSLKLDVEIGSELDNWLRGIFKKVTTYCNSEEELINLYNKTIEKGLTAVMIEDNGLTHFHGIKTKTCFAVGFDEKLIDEVTGHLKLL